jgi:hypothetical protein
MLMILSGCTVEYNIEIDKNMKIDEETKVIDDTYNTSQPLYISKEEMLKNLIDPFTSQLDDSQYEYVTFNDETGAGVILTATYDGITDYKSKEEISSYKFKDYDITADGNLVTLKTTIPYPYVEQDPNRVQIKKLVVNVTLPFKVVENNADKVNGNKYTWVIEGYQYKKPVILTFDKTKQANHFYLFNIIPIPYFVFGIIGGIIAIAIIIFILTKVNANNNKI